MLKILLVCNNFSYLSGSPLYVYTLAKELVTLGNKVTICSEFIGGIITDKARESGIEVISLKDLDKNRAFDVKHLNQNWSKHFLDWFDCPTVYTIHSEFECERPIIDERIDRYIAIRPTISQKWGIEADIIYNPIDFSRFHKYPTPKSNLTLFVGTIDPLRKHSAQHLMSQGGKVRFVGQKFDNWTNKLPENAEWYPDTWDIEEHLKDATETAGIMLGRTTLEGFACGLPGIIYDVDERGNIKSITRHGPPEDMSIYDSKLVAKRIYDIYCDTINKRKKK